MDRLLAVLHKVQQQGKWPPPLTVAPPQGGAAARALSALNARLVACPTFDPVAAEQYRKLYIEIAQARRTRTLQTLLMTSALAGEGKSISALNLAMTGAAQAGPPGVLLIDTDLRQPRLHTYLGLQPRWGLTDYLLGDLDYVDLLCPTPIPGLTLIAAGRRVSNPTALLASARMEHLLGEVKAHQPYSAIILDSSPVLLTSETKGLLPYIDTTILVVRARQTPRALVLQAIKTLGEENLLGCLFNGVVASDFSSYHYYNSSAYYTVRDTDR